MRNIALIFTFILMCLVSSCVDTTPGDSIKRYISEVVGVKI